MLTEWGQMFLKPMTATRGGMVPSPPNDPTKYLNGQGTWTTPTGIILIPAGGSTGQVLAKASVADYDLYWRTITSGGSGSGAPVYDVMAAGGAAGNDTTDDSALLATADAAALALGIPLYFPLPSAKYKVSGAFVLNSHCVFAKGAMIHGVSGSVTLNGKVTAEITQILALDAGVTCTISGKVNPWGFCEWFGAIPNDKTKDCAPAINQSIRALPLTILLGNVYYVSTTRQPAAMVGYTSDTACVVQEVGCGRLEGFGGIPYNVNTGVIGYGTPTSIVTGTGAPGKRLQALDQALPTPNTTVIRNVSGSTTTLWGCSPEMDSLNMGNFVVDRAVAPVISSACIGARLNGSWGNCEKIYSIDSMVGFDVRDSLQLRIRDCTAFRNQNGSGAGTDYWYGWHFGGTKADGLVAQNFSLYLHDCNAHSAFYTAAGNFVGFWGERYISDIFLNHVESGTCDIGMKLSGGAPDNDFGNTTLDFTLLHGIFDSCGVASIVIDGLNNNGSINIMQCQGGGTGTASAVIQISNTNCPIKIDGMEYQGFMMTGGAPMLKLTLANNVQSINGNMLEAYGPGVWMSGSSNGKFTDKMTNYVSTTFPYAAALYDNGTTGCSHNQFAMSMGGPYAYQGYKLISTAYSGYNDFNCSGIPVANKLLVGGSWIILPGRVVDNYPTITGVTGSNYASGIMYT